jgi:hypothetical protein
MRRVLLLLSFLPLFTYGQDIEIGMRLGYCSPKGSVFTVDGQEAGFGLGADFFATYKPGWLNSKLAVGALYNQTIIFGQHSNEAFDIGAYGLSLYSLYGKYEFLEGDFTPYAGLALGYSNVETPEVSSGDNIIKKQANAGNLGLRPEVGIDLNGLQLSVAYLVPMNYSKEVENAFIIDDSMGYLKFSIGYAYAF